MRQTWQSDYLILLIFFCCLAGIVYDCFPNILDYRDRLMKAEYTEEMLENYSRLVPEIHEKLGTWGCENLLATYTSSVLEPSVLEIFLNDVIVSVSKTTTIFLCDMADHFYLISVSKVTHLILRYNLHVLEGNLKFHRRNHLRIIYG